MEEARFLTSRVEEKASLSLVLRSISLRDECPSHGSSKTIMRFSKGNHGHGLDEECGLDEKCVEENKYPSRRFIASFAQGA